MDNCVASIYFLTVTFLMFSNHDWNIYILLRSDSKRSACFQTSAGGARGVHTVDSILWWQEGGVTDKWVSGGAEDSQPCVHTFHTQQRAAARDEGEAASGREYCISMMSLGIMISSQDQPVIDYVSHCDPCTTAVIIPMVWRRLTTFLLLWSFFF